jgi:hypothetical protein
VEIEVLRDVVERVVLLPVRVRHRARVRKKRRARAHAIATTRQTLVGARGLNARNIQTIFNVCLYLLLLDQDLADFTDDMMYTIGDHKRRFVAKHEAILLYEAAEDVPQLLGREFRAAVAALGATAAQLNQLNEASSRLHRFWREHRGFLGEIRQALSAHREHDALAYVEKLDAVRPLDVMNRAAEFSSLLERLIRVLTDLAGLTVGIPALIGDMKRSTRQ